MIISERIQKIVDENRFPTDEELVEMFIFDQRVVETKGINWEFEREWPASVSDQKFSYIAKLVAVFSKTKGGLVFFGGSREKGEEDEATKLERFSNNIAEYLYFLPIMSIMSYNITDIGYFECLLVLPFK